LSSSSLQHFINDNVNDEAVDSAALVNHEINFGFGCCIKEMESNVQSLFTKVKIITTSSRNGSSG